jgi:pimeloyl-ACP methyl ester carboxylesterase
MRRFKKILKITFIILSILLVAFYILFYWVTAPKPDEKVLEAFQEAGVTPMITHEQFRTFDYRKVAVVKDTSLPTIVFVHGTIGSVLDFKKYMTDSLLQTKANMIIYDRIGYNYEDQNDVQESIAFEAEMLEDIVKDLNPKKTILAGYSYGGPIVLASKKPYQKVILFAPAVYSKVEPMPGLLKLYEWQLTRWIVPPIWKQASKEKLSHRQDLQKFERTWNENPNQVVCIHGDGDWIVPYSNSEYLENIFPENQFKLITISEANHDLIWSNFEELRTALLNELD